MKILVGVVALSFVICSGEDVILRSIEDPNEIPNPIEECFINAGVNEEEFTRFNKDIDSFEEADVATSVRCAIKCILDKLPLNHPVTGEFLPKELRDEMFPAGSEPRKVLDGCKVYKGEHPCDATFLTWICIMKYDWNSL